MEDEGGKRTRVKGSKKTAETEAEPASAAGAPKAKKARGRPNKKKDDSSDDSVESSSASPKKKKAKQQKTVEQRITERDTIPKLWKAQDHPSSYTFKIASWNVAGLRALMKNHANVLSNLCQQHDLDVLCLQEIKLQENHVDDPKLKINGHLLEEEGYDAYYSCATAKKGYAGTAVFVKRRGGGVKGGGGKKQAKLDAFFGGAGKINKENAAATSKSDANLPVDIAYLIPQDVSMKMGKAEHDAEGRIITLDFPLFSMAALYVPNSGQKLERLDYRTEQWDKDLLKYMQDLQKKRGVPVMWLGDLNVAHTALEVWNDGAKHLSKQAGVTPQERASFQAQLDAGFVDAFRKLHPTAKGHYSYWSQRAGNREPNKGLRLDYFVCSPEMFDEDQQVVVRDSYMLSDVKGSDHCPVVLELEIKQK
jgi:exodeoxyribonuclease III